MTANSLYRSIGSFSLPLSTYSADTAEGLDPARDILLGLLAAAINDELGQAWTAVSGTGTSVLAGTTPITSTCPDEPDPQMLQTTEHAVPMLCVYREERATWTEDGESLSWPFHIDYILGPMTVGDRRKMKDFLVAVAKVILMVIERGGHKAYATQSGHTSQPKFVLGPGTDTANLEKLKPTQIQVGPAGFAGNDTKYWALSITVECEEGADFSDSDPVDHDYDGVSGAIGTGTGVDEDDPDGLTGIIDPLVELRTDHDHVYYYAVSSSGPLVSPAERVTFEGDPVSFDD